MNQPIWFQEPNLNDMFVRLIHFLSSYWMTESQKLTDHWSKRLSVNNELNFILFLTQSYQMASEDLPFFDTLVLSHTFWNLRAIVNIHSKCIDTAIEQIKPYESDTTCGWVNGDKMYIF